MTGEGVILLLDSDVINCRDVLLSDLDRWWLINSSRNRWWSGEEYQEDVIGLRGVVRVCEGVHRRQSVDGRVPRGSRGRH